MTVGKRSLFKRTVSITMAYVLVLGSINVTMPLLFSKKTNAWTKDITSIISNPDEVTTTLGTPVDIKITAEETPGVPGWIGYEQGKITANIPSGLGLIVASACSAADWTSASASAEATVERSTGIEFINLDKGYVNEDFCYQPAQVGSYDISFISDLPYGYFEGIEWKTGSVNENDTTKVNVDPLQLTIRNPNLTEIKVYDGNNTAEVIPGTLSGVLPGDDVTVSASAAYDSKNVGVDKDIKVVYSLGGVDAGNYLAPASELYTTGKITAKPITVTAQPGTKTYGADDPEFLYTFAAGDIVGTDTFSGALTRDAGDNVGVYPITKGSLTLGDNYEITFVGANFEITPAKIEITANDQTKVYGTADPALTYTVTDGSLFYLDAISGDLTRQAGNDVGEYAIGQGTLAVNSNYNVSFVPGKLAITPAEITITADDIEKVAGNADPALTYKITSGSLVTGDNLSGVLSRIAGETAGLYQINIGTLSNLNYLITFINGVFKIVAAPVVVPVETATTTTEQVAYDEATVETGEDATAAVAGNEKDAEVASATDTKDEKSTTWKIIGMAWYWWLLIIAAIGIVGWWLFAPVKRRSNDDSSNK